MPSYILVTGHRPVEVRNTETHEFELLNNPGLQESFQLTPWEVEAEHYNQHQRPRGSDHPECDNYLAHVTCKICRIMIRRMDSFGRSLRSKVDKTLESGRAAMVSINCDTAVINAGRGPVISEVKQLLSQHPEVKFIYWKSPKGTVERRCTLQEFLDSNED